ncbi:PTS-dependent dihydroxyacetone kinase phosphotransferase subunit DhaM [Schaalia sp. ZJ405]|nr:PTS-dependent dihydroxyacetone kinase phosphotransferase subunit DhaM [Schaalia sp. ZJ405]
MARVALVIASHSKLLAQGLVELSQQMAPDVTINAAGGTEDGGIGTSYDLIEAAVNSALASVEASGHSDEDSGVVILTDLGSATMTVESVLEFADDPQRLQFVDAPLVEGAVAAAVRAQLDDPIGSVAAAARGAYRRGAEIEGEDPLAGADAGSVDQTTQPEASGAITADAVVADPVGLHARPAALLARQAAGFDAEITVNGADAASVLEVMALGVKQGETVHLVATGPDAAEAIVALVELLETA